jgi:hypothetical protein
MIKVSKKPMQEHIKGGDSFIFLSLDKAIFKFKTICNSLDYEYTEDTVDGCPHYEAGGIGHDYRVELEVLILPNNQ